MPRDKNRNKKHMHKGEMRSAVEIAAMEGISTQEVWSYIRCGQSIDGRGAGARYLYKDGLDYNAKKIAEMEGKPLQKIKWRLRNQKPLDGTGEAKRRERSPSRTVKIIPMLAQWGYPGGLGCSM